MSDPWIINANLDVEVGSVDITASGNLVELVDHGVNDGDRVAFQDLSGGASALAADGHYWVVNANTDDFQVSEFLQGHPVEFASDGSATCYRFQPAYTAREVRRLFSGWAWKSGANARFGARQGIHPACDPAVTLDGSNYIVNDITGIVYPALTSTDGPYMFAHPSETAAIAAADGTDDRHDRLDLQIQDNDEDGSGERRARVVYTEGTAEADPSTPTQPDNSLLLAVLLVPAGDTAGASIIEEAPMTVAAGGTIPVREDSELPDSAAGLYDGAMRWNRDTGELEVWREDSGEWEALVSREITEQRWEYVNDPAGDLITSNTEFDIPEGRYDIVKVYARGAMTESAFIVYRINGDDSSGLHRVGYTVFNHDDGSIEESATLDAINFTGPQWGATVGCTAEATFYNVSRDSLLGYEAHGTRASSVDGSRKYTIASGNLSANRLLSSIEVRSAAAANAIDSVRVWIEGRRV